MTKLILYETYYFLRDNGETGITTYVGAIDDKWRLSQGNCFKTKREVAEYKKTLGGNK